MAELDNDLDDKSKTGDDGNADKTAGKKTDDASGKKAGDDKKGDKKSEEKDEPKGKFMTDDDVNAIVQARLTRERKKDAENAKLSKEQVLEKERDEANAKAAEGDLKDQFILASKLPYEKALRVFRMYRPDIETDDKGKGTNISDVLKTARAEYPELFPAVLKGKGDGGDKSGDGKSTGVGMNEMLRRRAGRG